MWRQFVGFVSARCSVRLNFSLNCWFVLNGFGYLHCLVNLIPKTACEVFELRRNFFVDWNLTSLVHFLFMRVVLAYLLDMAIHIVLTVPLHLAHVSFIAQVP